MDKYELDKLIDWCRKNSNSKISNIVQISTNTDTVML